MDGLVEELLRLESAKHKALILIDACAYDASVREQLRLVADSKQSPPGAVSNVEQTARFVPIDHAEYAAAQNLLSTTPLFAISGNGYTASGRVSPPNSSGRVSVEV
jgi:hypothetical protein